MRLQSDAPAKKPYRPPKLVVYGDLTEMTLSKGSTGMKDGGAMIGMRRTG
jgi:hypothetical protein